MARWAMRTARAATAKMRNKVQIIAASLASLADLLLVIRVAWARPGKAVSCA